MDKREDISRKLAEFRTRLDKDFPTKKLIFFGSLAQGRGHKDSDIDLIIVSKKFKKLNFIERGAKMYDYWNLKMPVDFLCYTPEEFEKLSKGVTIVREALKEGIVI